MSSRSGQVAVILIILTALALIFYAVSLNVNKLSEVKTLTQISSNIGASQLGSQMASYGQSIFMTTMGGKKKICAFTGGFLALIGLIIVIIIVIVAAYFTMGSSLSVLGPIATALGVSTTAIAVTAMVAAVALATINLILQLAVVQPGLTSMWNKITASTLPIADQFVENAISRGLAAVVTDTAQVPDLYDWDTDRIWGWDTGEIPKEHISRFAYYYNYRLQQIQAIDQTAVQAFISALEDLVVLGKGGEPGWALYDPINCDTEPDNKCCYDPVDNPLIPSSCNPCCLPVDVVDPRDFNASKIPLRPVCCDLAVDDPGICGVSTTCGADTPPEVDALNPFGTGYPYVFDPYYENDQNNNRGTLLPFNVRTGQSGYSFRELIGRDDEHPGYEKTGPNIYRQRSKAPIEYQVEDATGYYKEDIREGIYPFFWKIQDWQIELSALDIEDPLTAYKDCYYVDGRFETGRCAPPLYSKPIPEELSDLPPLNLPVDPTQAKQSFPNDLNSVQYNTTWWVDGTDIPAGITNPPAAQPGVILATDKFRMPIAPAEGDWDPPPYPYEPVYGPSNIFVDDLLAGSRATNEPETVCAEEMLFANLPRANSNGWGFWDKGNDRYCSVMWPYFVNCPKHIESVEGGCAEGIDDESLQDQGACSCQDVKNFDSQSPYLKDFNDDILDNLVYGLPEFFDWALPLIESSKIDMNALAKSMEEWYPDAADWIEQLSPPASRSGEPPCFSCDPEGGVLYLWMREINEMLSRLDILKNDTSYEGAPDNYEEVWCVPPTLDNGEDRDLLTDPAEVATFNSNGNQLRGDFEDILACLEYNTGQGSLANIARGNNWERFERCSTSCSAADCDRLPRSLLPRGPGGFEPSDFLPPDDSDQPAHNPPQTANEAQLVSFLPCLWNCNDVFCRNMMSQAFQRNNPPPGPTPANRLSYYFGIKLNPGNPPTIAAPADPGYFCQPNASNRSSCMPVNLDGPIDEGLPPPAPGCYFSITAVPVDASGNPSGPEVNNGSVPPGLFNLIFRGDYRTTLQSNMGCDMINSGSPPPFNTGGAISFTLTPAQIAAFNTPAGFRLFSTPLVSNPSTDIYTSCTLTARDPVSGQTRTCKAGLAIDNSPPVFPRAPTFPGQLLFNGQHFLNISAGSTINITYTAADDGDNIFPFSCTDLQGNAITVNGSPVPSGNLIGASRPPPPFTVGPVDKSMTCKINAVHGTANAMITNSTAILTVTGYPSFSPFFFEGGDMLNDPIYAQFVNDYLGGVDQPVCAANPQTGIGEWNFGVQPVADRMVEWIAKIIYNGGTGTGAPPDGNPPINPTCSVDIKTGDGWLNDVRNSVPEAKNQVAKFAQRYNLLKTRYEELVRTIDVLKKAADELDSFLNGPAADFIRSRINFKGPLSYHVIYSWQDMQPGKNRLPPNEDQGYWHAVKIEARTPRRCDNACGAGGGGDPEWPRVKTWTEMWGMRRCYELVNTEGRVKFRVTRWDENRDTVNMLRFPNGVPIWDFRSKRPDRMDDPAPDVLSVCNSVADSQMPSGLELPVAKRSIWGKAFIMNDRTEDNKDCWLYMHRLLRAGVVTETCAEYYFHDSGNRGLSFQFVPCAPF